MSHKLSHRRRSKERNFFSFRPLRGTETFCSVPYRRSQKIKGLAETLTPSCLIDHSEQPQRRMAAIPAHLEPASIRLRIPLVQLLIPFLEVQCALIFLRIYDRCTQIKSELGGELEAVWPVLYRRQEVEGMKHWKVILDGYGDRGKDSGYVCTQDGEVIGEWSADAEDHCSFTPLGRAEPIIWNPFLGLFCQDVFDWHAAKIAGREAEWLATHDTEGGSQANDEGP